ncbi:MAG: HD domain-containing protein [Planctomycetes bacterium]|nr:HD domain-containing protein [Planctomycetota bacterium]
MITLDQVRNHPETKIFMDMADTNLAAMGYTEHGARHAKLVAAMTQYILEKLGYDQKTRMLGAIAGFLHDIGNAINRNDHGISSAFLAYQILKDLKADSQDIARIISAAGNHDEERGEPVNNISAAVVIADKADVHSSRVRSTKEIDFDIHDRVNYAVKKSRLQVNPKLKTITLEISIDNRISKVMEYFEIFLTRMMACQKAAKLLGCEFKLVINNTKLL